MNNITLWKEIFLADGVKLSGKNTDGVNLGAMKKQYTKIHDLSVSNELLNFINNELLKDTKVSSEKFWEGFSNVVHELAPKNKELINIRKSSFFKPSTK